MIDWSLALAAANVVLGTILALSSWNYARKSPPEPWKWIKYALAAVGVYWSWLYLYVVSVSLFGVTPADPVWFGRSLVRPAFTITLAVITAGAIARVRKM